MADIMLVQMPFALPSAPSLALGLFKKSLSDRGISVKVKYGSIKLLQNKKYHMIFMNIMNSSALMMMGEFVFASLLDMKMKHDMADYIANIEKMFYTNKYAVDLYKKMMKEIPEYQEYLKRFLDELVDEILKENPKIVTSSSLFQQTNASLALFQRIKKRNPDVITIMGGPNCMTGAGLALTKAFPFLDYAFSGEGDEYVPVVLEKLLKGEKIDAIDGVITKDTASDRLQFPLVHNMEEILQPDYDDYFAALKEYDLEKNVISTLFIEGSRGCWWGQKKPCTFCGLGGESRLYRQKSTEKLVAELESYQEKYGINKFAFSDSILSMTHVKELPEKLRGKNFDLFSETKSNLTKEEVKALADGGFTYIQPGIESLHDEVLKLMNKGNKGLKHIALLKWCRIYDIALSWNILYGFPEEKEEWYDEMNEILPLLTHLYPPNAMIHILYQKYSTYTNDPEKYGLEIVPSHMYDYVYPDIEGLKEGIAYMFEPKDQEQNLKYYNPHVIKDCYNKLSQIYKMWQKGFFNNLDRLEMGVKGDSIEICDFRQVATDMFITLKDIKKDIYLLAENVVKIDRVKECLKDKYIDEDVDRGIDELIDQKLMVRYNGEIIALAVQLEGYGTKNMFKNRMPMGIFIPEKC